MCQRVLVSTRGRTYWHVLAAKWLLLSDEVTFRYHEIQLICLIFGRTGMGPRWRRMLKWASGFVKAEFGHLYHLYLYYVLFQVGMIPRRRVVARMERLDRFDEEQAEWETKKLFVNAVRSETLMPQKRLGQFLGFKFILIYLIGAETWETWGFQYLCILHLDFFLTFMLPKVEQICKSQSEQQNVGITAQLGTSSPCPTWGAMISET